MTKFSLKPIFNIKTLLFIFVCFVFLKQPNLFENNPTELFYCFSKFAVKNFCSFLVLYLILKKDSISLKISMFLIIALSFYIYYNHDTTSNIATILFYLSTNYDNKIKKFILLSISFIILSHTLISPVFYKYKYAIPEIKNIDTSLSPKIKLIDNPNKETFKVKNYEIELQKIASIELNAKAVFIEHYNKLFSYDYYEHPLYDTIAPLDLSVFIGEMANNWKSYKIEHEQRLLLVKPLNGENLTDNEWNNIHIIPSNTNIHKGFHTVKKGDDIYLKGYLIDWNGLGEFNYFKIKTARYFGEASSQQAGGRFTYLCTQFLVEELNVNGHTFK